MSGISDEEYHHLLVHQNRERIELAATQAFEQQLENPVVLLLDMDDPVARAIVETAGLQTRIEPIVAENQRREVVTVLISHLPGDSAHNLLQNYYPGLGRSAVESRLGIRPLGGRTLLLDF